MFIKAVLVVILIILLLLILYYLFKNLKIFGSQLIKLNKPFGLVSSYLYQPFDHRVVLKIGAISDSVISNDWHLTESKTHKNNKFIYKNVNEVINTKVNFKKEKKERIINVDLNKYKLYLYNIKNNEERDNIIQFIDENKEEDKIKLKENSNNYFAIGLENINNTTINSSLILGCLEPLLQLYAIFRVTRFYNILTFSDKCFDKVYNNSDSFFKKIICELDLKGKRDEFIIDQYNLFPKDCSDIYLTNSCTSNENYIIVDTEYILKINSEKTINKIIEIIYWLYNNYKFEIMNINMRKYVYLVKIMLQIDNKTKVDTSGVAREIINSEKYKELILNDTSEELITKIKEITNSEVDTELNLDNIMNNEILSNLINELETNSNIYLSKIQNNDSELNKIKRILFNINKILFVLDMFKFYYNNDKTKLHIDIKSVEKSNGNLIKLNKYVGRCMANLQIEQVIKDIIYYRENYKIINKNQTETNFISYNKYTFDKNNTMDSVIWLNNFLDHELEECLNKNYDNYSKYMIKVSE